MMNRSSSAEAFLVSSMTSIVDGLDAAASSHNPAAMAAAFQNQTFFLNPPALDCPAAPGFLPIGNLPLYSPPPPPAPDPARPEYLPVAGLLKRDLFHFGGAGRIGLNLGHRTCFSPGDPLAIDRLLGRSRPGLYSLGGGHGHRRRPPRCQAEGCRADLSGAKHYHRRHKVCEFHSKASVSVVAGLHQRFCQQCSRFHVLAEFDESKRSCRKRLADHNRRRRKPQVILPAAAAAPPPASAAAHDRSSSVSVSVSKNTNTNSNSNNPGKSKQLEKTTTVPAKSTICHTNIVTSKNSSSNGEGHHQCPKQGNLMRTNNNGPALYLGGAAAEKVGNGLRSNTMYQVQGPRFPALEREKPVYLPPPPPQQQQQQQNFQSYYLFGQAGDQGNPAGGRPAAGRTEHVRLVAALAEAGKCINLSNMCSAPAPNHRWKN